MPVLRSNPPLVLVPRLADTAEAGTNDARRLVAFIRAHATVTLALERWCDLAGLGDGPITARPSGPSSVVTNLDLEIATALDLLPGRRTSRLETVIYRSVELRRGLLALVEADNWYVPERLPADINQALQTTNSPFGKLIAPVGASRSEVRSIDQTVGRSGQAMPRHLFAQSAVISISGGTRVAFVRERFLPALLGPPGSASETEAP